MAVVPLAWKLSIRGAEEVRQKLEEINNQLKSGQTVKREDIQQVRSQVRDYRMLNQGLAQTKSLFLAAHPSIRGFSEAMSVAGRVSHAMMSVMNTLNLASLVLGQTDAALAQKLKDREQAVIELTKAYESMDPNKIGEAQKKLGDIDTDLAETMKENTAKKREALITFGATAIFTASSVTQALIQAAATTKGRFALVALEAVAAFAAVLYGGIGILAAVSPQYAQGMDNLVNAIKNKYNVDGLTALLASPFISLQIIIETAAAQMEYDWVNFVNTIIDGKNAIIDALNTITFGLLDLQKQVKLDLPGTDTSKRMIHPWEENIIPAYPTIQSQYEKYFQKIPKGGGGSQTPFNNLVNTIQTGPNQGMSYDEVLAKAMENAKELYENSQTIDKITDPLKEANDFATQANNLANDIKLENQQVNSTLTNINSTHTKLLSESLGVNTSGVLGIIDIAKQTALINDNLSKIGPSFLRLSGGSTITPNLTPAEEYAIKMRGNQNGYLGSNGKWYPDKETAKANGAAATGFDGLVSSPMNLLIGESGPEYVSVTPIGGNRQNKGGVIINNYIAGSIRSDKDLEQLMDNYFKTQLKKLGFGS